jgi:hypothetical protein
MMEDSSHIGSKDETPAFCETPSSASFTCPACGWRPAILLDCEEQFRHGLVEAPADEMRDAYKGRRANAGGGTEAQRDLGVLDRHVGLARPSFEDAADVPSAGVDSS